ncbi:MAG: hypothetical protein ACRDGM_11060 [bacterium]
MGYVNVPIGGGCILRMPELHYIAAIKLGKRFLRAERFGKRLQRMIGNRRRVTGPPAANQASLFDGWQN